MFKRILRSIYENSESAHVPLIVLGAFGWFISMLAQMAGIKGNKQLSPDKKKFLLAQEKNEGICNIGLYLLLTTSLSAITKGLYKNGRIITSESKDFLQNFVKKQGLNSIDELYKKAKFAKKSVGKYVRSIDPESYDETFGKDAGLGTFATIIGSIVSCNILTPIFKNKMAYNAITKENARTSRQIVINKPQLTVKPTVFENSKVFSGLMKI